MREQPYLTETIENTTHDRGRGGFKGEPMQILCDAKPFTLCWTSLLIGCCVGAALALIVGAF